MEPPFFFEPLPLNKKERKQWGRYDGEWKKEAVIEREDGQDIELDK